MLAFVLYVSFLGESFRSVTNLLPVAALGTVALGRIHRTLLPAEGETGSQNIESFSRIVLDDVSYAYDESTHVLCHCNATLQKGSVYVLLGPNGAGKSTLLDLLMGYTVPREGAVFADTQDLRNVNIRQYQKHLAVVLQEDLVLDSSIEVNLRMAQAAATERAMGEALVAVGLAETESDALGLLSRDASTLSTGQKRCLSLARASLRSPSLLILDEATANLDGAHVQIAIQWATRVSRTAIVVFATQDERVVGCAFQRLALRNGALVSPPPLAKV